MRSPRLIAPAAALAAGGALLAGCATPAPPATLSFAGTGCAATPDLAKAASLTPEKPKDMFVVTTPVTAASPCLAGPARPYAVYALPKDPSGKTVMVGSVLEGARIFAPEVVLLDASGQKTRDFAPTDYFYRADVYSVQFQPRPNEAYVLVAADPARVAGKYDSIAIGTQSTYISAGAAGGMNWRSGVDQKQSRTFSYDGAVQVTVYDANAKPPKK